MSLLGLVIFIYFYDFVGTTQILCFLLIRLLLMGHYRYFVHFFFNMYDLHGFVYANNLWRSARNRSWWQEERTWEQCAFGYNWKYVVCCHYRCSSHGGNMYFSLNFLIYRWFILNAAGVLVTGVFCIWHCSENCYIWKEWSNSGSNSIPWY